MEHILAGRSFILEHITYAGMYTKAQGFPDAPRDLRGVCLLWVR